MSDENEEEDGGEELGEMMNQQTHLSGINTSTARTAIRPTSAGQLLVVINRAVDPLEQSLAGGFGGRVRCEIAPGKNASEFTRLTSLLVRQQVSTPCVAWEPCLSATKIPQAPQDRKLLIMATDNSADGAYLDMPAMPTFTTDGPRVALTITMIERHARCLIQQAIALDPSAAGKAKGLFMVVCIVEHHGRRRSFGLVDRNVPIFALLQCVLRANP